MGGIFGVALRTDCVNDLFYGTDYHSRLGTSRGGLAVRNTGGIQRHIHDITTTQFRSKFEDDIKGMSGRSGIGVISDYESQPLIIGSHLGVYAIATVAVVKNLDRLTSEAFGKKQTHFSEMSDDGINPTEVVATLINQSATFEEGIAVAQNTIQGSCTLLLLTAHGIYAARDRLGRTPLVIAAQEGARAADRYELKNLAEKFPDRAREMSARWQQIEDEFRRQAGPPPPKKPAKAKKSAAKKKQP